MTMALGRALVPVSVSVPPPCFVTAPEPLMMPEKVEASERLKMSVPLFVRALTPSTPLAPPTPIWSVPPEFRLIVPAPPCESVPATDTRPPFMVSVPVPASPTSRLPLLAHVPLDTVAIPTLS